MSAIERELLTDYRFGKQQLIEIWGHACALAVTKVRRVHNTHICHVLKVHQGNANFTVVQNVQNTLNII